MIGDAIALLLIALPIILITVFILETGFEPTTQRRLPRLLCKLGIHFYATFLQEKKEGESLGRTVSRCVRCGKYEYPDDNPDKKVQEWLQRNRTEEYIFEEWSKNNERL